MTQHACCAMSCLISATKIAYEPAWVAQEVLQAIGRRGRIAGENQVVVSGAWLRVDAVERRA